MTIKELEIAYEAAAKAWFEHKKQVDEKCKAEGRMAKMDDPWGGYNELTPKWNEEERAESAELSRKRWTLSRELDEAKKADRKAKIAARNAKKNAELGITEEQRKAMVNAKRKATEIKRAQEEIARLQEEIKEMEARKEYYEKIAKGL